MFGLPAFYQQEAVEDRENNPAARKLVAFKSKDDYFVSQGGTKSLERRPKSHRETFLDLEN